jgi:hypothetical protein
VRVGNVVVVAVVVVVSADDVLVVPTVVVVVVLAGGQGFGSHVPSPTTTPPSVAHSAGFRSSQESRMAPPGDVGRQHWVSAGTPAGAQPCSTASHQLAKVLAQAEPFRGALHFAAGMTAHLVRPRRLVLQHVTAPARPQVDRAAHFITSCFCLRERRRAATSAFTACATHFM